VSMQEREKKKKKKEDEKRKMDCEGCERKEKLWVKMCHLCERLLCDRCWGGTNFYVCGRCVEELEAEKKGPRVASPGQEEEGQRR